VEAIDGRVREQTGTDALASRVVHLFSMKSENLVELKKLRDTGSAARAAMANLGSVEYWDHIIVFIMLMKFGLERDAWSKTLGKSGEHASYEQFTIF